MLTKLPGDLQAGDRMVRRDDQGRELPAGVVQAFASDPPTIPLAVLFTDGSTVVVTDLDVPVEVHP